jgi:hypothetical protein
MLGGAVEAPKHPHDSAPERRASTTTTVNTTYAAATTAAATVPPTMIAAPPITTSSTPEARASGRPDGRPRVRSREEKPSGDTIFATPPTAMTPARIWNAAVRALMWRLSVATAFGVLASAVMCTATAS